jgi:hypothetical protein
MTSNIINKKNKYKQVKKYLKELSDAGLIKYTDSEDGENVSIQLINMPTLNLEAIMKGIKEGEND